MISLKGPVPILLCDRMLNWYSVAGDRPFTCRLQPEEEGTGTENQFCLPSLSPAVVFFTLQTERGRRSENKRAAGDSGSLVS